MNNFFPPKEQDYSYLQVNRGDNLGSIWSSFGLDFQSNLGTMRVAPRMRIASQTSDLANLGLPVAFKYFEGSYFSICGSRLFINTTGANGAWTENAGVGVPTDFTAYSDLEIFAGLIWATSSGNLVSANSSSGAWTDRDNYSTSKYLPLAYFENVPGGRLYYLGTSNEIWSIATDFTIADDPGVEDYCIDLIDIVPSCMKSTDSDIWVGTDFTLGDDGDPEALVLQWDGISNQLTKQYAVKGAAKIQSILIMNSVPYVMDNNGILSKFTGYSFEEVGRLPFNPKNPDDDFVMMNGMIATENNTILVNVNNLNGDNENSIYENLPSGTWEWSEQFGFVHKYAFTYNTNSNTTVTDYGQNRISASGALFDATPFEHGASGWNGQILAGATIYTNGSSTTNAIFFDDTTNAVQKKGYFVTTWFYSEEIQDQWQKLWTTYRKFLTATDSIVMKYRLSEEDPVYANITWVNTTSFTTTTDVSAYAPTSPDTVGYEVEIIQGTGSGSCVHVTSVTNNAGTYTVTLNQAVQGVTTGTAKARFQKWILLNPVNAQNQILSYSEMKIGGTNGVNATGIRIQLKGCMTFTGNGEFYRASLVSNEDIKITS